MKDGHHLQCTFRYFAKLRDPTSSASRKPSGEVTICKSSVGVAPGVSTSLASEVSSSGNEIVLRDPYVSCGGVRNVDTFPSVSASSGIEITVKGETDRFTLLPAGKLK